MRTRIITIVIVKCFLVQVALFIGFSLCMAGTSDDPNYAGMVDIGQKIGLTVYYSTVSTDSGATALSIKAVYQGLAWLGIGVNPSGEMIGGEAVIGQPNAAVLSENPGKYSMSDESSSGVVLMGSSSQTLINGSISQDTSAGTTTQTADARLGKLKGRKPGNATTEGNPNGWKNGRGKDGMGKGTNSGIQGNGGRMPGKGGSGGVYAEFRNFEISSSTVKITADGRGKIRCSVKVDCNGKWSIVRAGLIGTTYTGQPTDANYRNVFKQAMRGVIFKKTGTDCPETRTVTADIQPE